MAGTATASSHKWLEGATDSDNLALEANTSSDEDVGDAEADGPHYIVGLFSLIWNWKPKPAQYDPDNPPKFSLALNLLFAFVGIP